ncbi:hypothetical protein ACE1B6_16960 [Aerosakkonemataceae cyanobacterium BLCC-F154]|uniref:Uncharacterized protein n=1 Tax=Floridaenema fluviatile BLCC-F154 TaxID=3153640 RepID=A0ABV4YDN0_9CYAN
MSNCLLARSVYVVTSDICDYEVRRGLLLVSLTNPTVQGIQNLDNLPAVIDFLPLTQMVRLKITTVTKKLNFS